MPNLEQFAQRVVQRAHNGMRVLSDPNKPVTRGDLLDALGFAGATAAGVATLAGCAKRIPDAPSAESQLQATATALDVANKQDSFIPEAGFTQKDFEAVKQSTFNILFDVRPGTFPNAKEATAAAATMWLARVDYNQDGNDYYFVTNRHVAEVFLAGGSKTFKLWRSGIDKDHAMFYPEQIVMTDKRSDEAIIKIHGNYTSDSPLVPLVWEDYVSSPAGTKLLMVGFPGTFYNYTTGNFKTEGTVIEIINGGFTLAVTDAWYAKGLAAEGNSGSPALTKDSHGNLKVIGIVNGGRKMAVPAGQDTEQLQDVVAGYPLRLGHLMSQLR